MLLVAGITNTFPVFLPALLTEFGGSRGATAATASLLWLGGALLSPVAGYLVARWNPRLLVSLGLGLDGARHAAGKPGPDPAPLPGGHGPGGWHRPRAHRDDDPRRPHRRCLRAAPRPGQRHRLRGVHGGLRPGGAGPVDHHPLGLAARLLVLRGGHRRVDPLGLAHAPDASGVRRGPRATGAGGNRGDRLEHRPLRGLLEPPGDVHHAAALRLPRHHPAHALFHRARLHGGRGLAAPRHRRRPGGPAAGHWRACWPIDSAGPPPGSSRSPARCWACSA